VIVLDTNVVSELMRPSPAPPVVSWVAARPARSLYVTSITQAEIHLGILLLPRGRRRESIEAAAATMFEVKLAGRVLAFGSDAALHYARVVAGRTRAGRPISDFDAQIAAIASASGAKVATRDVDGFEGCGIDVENPWDQP
jgi:predicted nucleic acid-binding protein